MLLYLCGHLSFIHFFITNHHLYVALSREENQLDKSCNWSTTITETWFFPAKIRWQYIFRLFLTKSPSSHIVHLYSGKKNPILLGRLQLHIFAFHSIYCRGCSIVTIHNKFYMLAVLPQQLQVRKSPWYKSPLSLATGC